MYYYDINSVIIAYLSTIINRHIIILAKEPADNPPVEKALTARTFLG
jgi:hypothetical protein